MYPPWQKAKTPGIATIANPNYLERIKTKAGKIGI